jgi:RNA polymerase primary sigma factor
MVSKTKRSQRQLCQELGREPNPDELAQRLEMPVNKVLRILQRAQDTIPLDDSLQQDRSQVPIPISEVIVDEVLVSPLDSLIQQQVPEHIEGVLESLSTKEKRVIAMRFGLQDGSEHTLEQIGQRLKVTRERIRQIEAKALGKLKHPSRKSQLLVVCADEWLPDKHEKDRGETNGTPQ